MASLKLGGPSPTPAASVEEVHHLVVAKAGENGG